MSVRLNSVIGAAGRNPARPVVARLSLAALIAITAWGQPAAAETLRQALAAAYQTNPKLDAERARLRATDEEVPRTMSGWRPTVEASADYGRQHLTQTPAFSTREQTTPAGYSLTLVQEVFSGFRTVNSVGEAEATVRAGRENLRQVESSMLLDGVTAYTDVIRDQAIVRLREGGLDVLSKELVAVETRREVREVTRTDVAQARARRARAASDLDKARSNLKASRATYERIIGHPASKLTEPQLGSKLTPRSLETALQTGDQESPSVIAALYREQAARFGVDKITGELLPGVRLEASYGHRSDPGSGIDTQDAASVIGRITIPLYKGGETEARVRQAKHTHVSRLQEVEQARTETREAVTTAWSRLVAAKSQLKSDQAQVDANRIALEGVREEERVGQRTVIDVLNAEQELLDSEVRLATTRHDLVVANYALIGATGRLTAIGLSLASSVYDPEEHYKEVRQKWFGISITHADGRREKVDAADTVDSGPDLD